MKTTILLAMVLTMWGCHSNMSSGVSQDSAISDSVPLDGTVIDTAKTQENTSNISKNLKTFKGLYISGNEVSTFRDCDDTAKLYWVEDATKSITKRYHESKGVLSYPYESVYAEVRGYLKGKAKLGYAEDYENVLVVTKVISMKQKSFGTECYDFEYFGVGNEPFWALEIIPSENIIALKDVGHEKTYTFPYSSGKTSGNTTTYESRNDKNETIKAIIKKETCSDGMSDRIYNHSIRLVINDRILNGCAIKKGDKMPQNR